MKVPTSSSNTADRAEATESSPLLSTSSAAKKDGDATASCFSSLDNVIHANHHTTSHHNYNHNNYNNNSSNSIHSTTPIKKQYGTAKSCCYWYNKSRCCCASSHDDDDNGYHRSLWGIAALILGGGALVVILLWDTIIVSSSSHHHHPSSSSSSSQHSTTSSGVVVPRGNHHHHHPSHDDDHSSVDVDIPRPKKIVTVAFIGNSMFYFNDFPRFYQQLVGQSGNSNYTIVQNSCLHGGASLSSILLEGNAMYPQFRTDTAYMGTDVLQRPIYDYGACTVPQLLMGYDDRLLDPGYAVPNNNETSPMPGNPQNPCRQDAAYFDYIMTAMPNSLQQYHALPLPASSMSDDTVATAAGAVSDTTALGLRPPEASSSSSKWDYVIMNDNTKNPAQYSTRMRALANLERFYVPWLLETGATPIFLWTHAYHPAIDGPCVNPNTHTVMSNIVGLDSIANFTSLTRVGYQAYVDLLRLYLPTSQTPRIAPVGLAFLLVYEENYNVWQQLFHCDGIHASPSGTFLQGCIIHYTMFGTMPDYDTIVGDNNNITSLWSNARMMQHYWEPSNPIPNIQTAQYLYHVAERIMIHGVVPTSYIHYTNGEYASYAATATTTTSEGRGPN